MNDNPTFIEVYTTDLQYYISFRCANIVIQYLYSIKVNAIFMLYYINIISYVIYN